MTDILNTICLCILAGGFILVAVIVGWALAVRAGRGKRLRNKIREDL